MSTRADLQVAINTVLADGQTMPISQLRGLLKDDSVNLLDNIYADYNYDDETLQDFMTLGLDGSCKYNMLWCKQGRKVYMTVHVYDVVERFSLLGNLNIAETYPPLMIPTPELGNPSSYGIAYMVYSDGTTEETLASLRAAGSSQGQIFLKPSVPVGSELYITLFYNTKL